jgi:hypothetical protein
MQADKKQNSKLKLINRSGTIDRDSPLIDGLAFEYTTDRKRVRY